MAIMRVGSNAVRSKTAGSKALRPKAPTAALKSARPPADSLQIKKHVAELRRENEKLHRQVVKYEVANFSLKNRVAALEEILQNYGHIENPQLTRILDEVQERTRGAGDLLSNGPF